ncbi:hypothetical protein PHLCEN_2v11842 [Hermanssonia centrifuga]|uniref:Uncharacterized protein n=1 Tax=Hermanssonia centrifuga TaxID=98765 RepID=A0A2R6NIQ3_9APHY|nr:hypothetical protein PHLCEN_2v11842 [Hermanssonia centrifuga]
MYNTVSRVEGELLKRARSDGPIECDDEYWFHPDPAPAFKQTARKPSKVAFFTCLIRLN